MPADSTNYKKYPTHKKLLKLANVHYNLSAKNDITKSFLKEKQKMQIHLINSDRSFYAMKRTINYSKEIYNFISAMNQFTIKDIENLSGIKAHTWRIWEQRYGIGVSQRKESNHRFFDNDNLKQILRISYLYNNGIKISKIAALKPEEMNEMALTKLLKENENDFYIKELIESSIDLNEERFERTFSEALGKLGIEATMINILNPFQEKIGVLWLTDHVIPAQEHFTSNIIRQKLSKAINDLYYVKNTEKKEIILFTPENERHEIPLQFIHYLLKKNQNTVIYFGSNISLKSIEIYKQKHPFTYLWFHLITNLAGVGPNDYLKQISRQFADKQIIMSGVLVQQVTQVPENVRLLKSMKEIIDFTQKI